MVRVHYRPPFLAQVSAPFALAAGFKFTWIEEAEVLDVFVNGADLGAEGVEFGFGDGEGFFDEGGGFFAGLDKVDFAADHEVREFFGFLAK